MNIIFIPFLWELKEGETINLSLVFGQLIRKLNIDGTNKMAGTLDMNDRSLKHVEAIPAKKRFNVLGSQYHCC